MQGVLYEESSAWLFLLVTCVLGGCAAWMTGRGVALAWKPLALALAWSCPLAVAVRFFHFALFEGTFLSPHYFVVDLGVVAAFAAFSHRFHVARLMTRQYRWLYERTGPLTWREKAQA